MSRVKKYKKNIACLESFWDKKIENRMRLSVHPILEIVSKLKEVKYILLNCNTKEELRYNLNLLKKKAGYFILYLAFHGKPGIIELHDKTDIKIEMLANYMGKDFKNWIIYFGSCETIDVDENTIKNFINETEVAMVLGYKKDIYWRESAPLDFLLFDYLQEYKDMRKFWNSFEKKYKGLIKVTGLKAYHK